MCINTTEVKTRSKKLSEKGKSTTKAFLRFSFFKTFFLTINFLEDSFGSIANNSAFEMFLRALKFLP